ncbi:binding-protein-dependent transport systems inner membrane component [Paenibacillus vortex V453]|jgi:multiple sugar transport system permease protein|uniref:ABC transporter permease n=4 Tax=Paenibacillus TaxID=44249 RepID=A0A163EM01_9BACL|nr:MULTISPECIES: sugar ABC transporter permease [Paenibacillus]ANA78481.1 ABC transporter permease [Paenibacillus glucanolyticus]AVV57604.1 sugar ABC transporter permease [Paenibacillus glucanolyticus]AWP26763.1 ABC transporter permease [Paenibacillus sp. Cedars]EFU40280.1 binding-protein-dependent transport systems inner membrane component [Paenibacillus vortex V453]ETT34373.1 binding-protein-dependent transport systems inner membrane component [Paenibacillus sp. FSL R5-808]
MKRLRENEHITGYVFSAPFVLGFLIFTLYPILSSLYYSFTNYNLMEAPRWLGLANYERLFLEDDKIGKSFQVTFTYVFASVPLRLIFALFVAMILNTATKAVGLYRSAFYLPSLIGGSVAVAIMWQQIFGDKGLVNSALSLFGIHSTTSWIGNPSTALWTLIALSIWQFGSSMIIFLAGLKNIPRDYYEAASVDGANAVHRFFKITLPMLSPIILFNLTLQTISAFLTFTPAYIISRGEGGPLDQTLLYSLYLYRKAFSHFEMGYASALAWIMLLIVGVLTLLIFRSSTRWVHYESKGD